MAFKRSKTMSLEAQAFSKSEEMFESLDDCAHVLDGLREKMVIDKNVASTISKIQDRKKRNR